MGVDYSLACRTCKEFISLHKWSVIEEAGRFLVNSYYVGDRGYDSRYPLEKSPYRLDLTSRRHEMRLPQKDVRMALTTYFAVEKSKYSDWIAELAPYVQMFVSTHPDHKLYRHELFLYCDLGIEPWDWGEEGFSEWREHTGTVSYPGEYLPRNLIEDKGIFAVEAALECVSEHNAFVLVGNEDWYRQAFAKALEQHIQAKT